MTAPRILVMEDDPDLAALLTLELEDAGHQVTLAATVMAGLVAVQAQPPDLILLDLGLPDLDGSVLIDRLRANSGVPIIVLTARDAVEEKVRLLQAGADDYLVKPYAMGELLARIQVQLRREASRILTCGPLEVHLGSRQVFYGGAALPVTETELQIVALLAREPGRVYDRHALSAGVWGNRDVTVNNLEVHLSNLRRKLKVVGGQHLLRTVRGAGYALRP